MRPPVTAAQTAAQTGGRAGEQAGPTPHTTAGALSWFGDPRDAILFFGVRAVTTRRRDGVWRRAADAAAPGARPPPPLWDPSSR